VVARGRLTVYEAQGTYQLVARAIEPAGRGDLERAFRLLVAKLEKEGLFDEARKRPLPRYPRTVAVVTSPTGAAVRDIMATLARRFPCVDVLFAPVQVQGDRAPFEIVRALDALSLRTDVDVVILGRGGGSIEDLWAFNDESVARAIHRSRAPVVSAVGHETDVTIADFVADRRAATPTMAAEVVVPDRADVERRVRVWVESSAARLQARLLNERRRVAELVRSYALGQVRGRVERAMQTMDFTMDRMRRVAASACDSRRAVLEHRCASLSGLDPREVLRRGYTVCHDESGAHVLRAAGEAAAAGRMRITFHDGVVAASVEGAPLVKSTAKEATS
jgi:exodeoxyribonuclease VII large subunit